MLKRKALARMERWKRNKDNQALLVTGARQTGKTYLVEHFADENYDSCVKFDLVDQTDVCRAFSHAESSDELFMAISAFAGAELVPGRTVIFIDEVQACTNVVALLKYLVKRSDYDYIVSGSLLGIELANARSMPVGYLDVLEMYPLDFEEFCWANGMDAATFATVSFALNALEPVPGPVHNRLMKLYSWYLIVGGMPAAVDRFVATQDLSQTKDIQQSILTLYRMDITRYAKDDTLYIKKIFDGIPSQLATQSKRFLFEKVRSRGTYDMFVKDLLWLTNAGVAVMTRSVTEPRHPLRLAESRSYFKLFINDVGLLAAASGIDVAKSILSDRLGVNYGSIFENAVAQELHAHGHDLHYFRNKKMGEVDFLIETGSGRALPIEVKSGKDYKRHSALCNLLATDNYEVDDPVVLCMSNVKAEGRIRYLPVYMAAAL